MIKRNCPMTCELCDKCRIGIIDATARKCLSTTRGLAPQAGWPGKRMLATTLFLYCIFALAFTLHGSRPSGAVFVPLCVAVPTFFSLTVFFCWMFHSLDVQTRYVPADGTDSRGVTVCTRLVIDESEQKPVYAVQLVFEIITYVCGGLWNYPCLVKSELIPLECFADDDGGVRALRAAIRSTLAKEGLINNDA